MLHVGKKIHVTIRPNDNIDTLPSGRGSFIKLAHLTFDLDSCRAKYVTVQGQWQ